MPKPKSTKHWDDVLRGIRDPERYDPKARCFGGPWRMVKCKDGAYVCYELYLEVVENLRKSAEINPAQSPHDGIHTCSKGCKKPGCNRGLRDTIEEQDAQIEALKQDLLEQTATVRHLRMERVHDLNHIGGQQEELAALRSQFANSEQENARLNNYIERLEVRNAELVPENARLKADIKDLREDRIRMCDVTIEDIAVIAALKAEVERLRASSFVTAVPVEQYERVVKAGDAMADEYRRMCKGEPAAGWFHRLMAGNEDFKIEHLADWNAAKEGKPSV